MKLKSRIQALPLIISSDRCRDQDCPMLSWDFQKIVWLFMHFIMFSSRMWLGGAEINLLIGGIKRSIIATCLVYKINIIFQWSILQCTTLPPGKKTLSKNCPICRGEKSNPLPILRSKIVMITITNNYVSCHTVSIMIINWV